jgi:hypothetical protein
MAGSLNFKVDTSDSSRVAAELRAAAQLLPNTMRQGAAASAVPIAAGIRSEAAWSSRIPAAVSVRVNNTGAVVSIDSNIAPEAAALNNHDQAGVFEHPVFGNEWTVQQQARPFLVAGARRGRIEADRRFDAMLTRWERAAGFK